LISGAYIMRPQKIPTAVKRGAIDAGICGWDCVVESMLQDELVRVTDLNYSKKTNAPVRIVVFGKGKRIRDAENISVSSEYMNIARKRFKKARVDFSFGSTEVDVIADLYDYGVCVTETGNSLKENGLNILDTLLVSPTVLVAKNLTPEIEFLGKLLQGSLMGEKYQLIKMDVAGNIKKRVIKMLPSIQSPTVNITADGAFAIETVVPRNAVSDLIMKLQRVGARGIIVQDINIIM
jgi:ATP phosphoribosyltransferase